MSRAVLAVAMCLMWTTTVVAVPPTVDFPKETKAIGDYVILQPKTDAKAISYVKSGYRSGTVAGDGVEPFPANMLKDAKTFMLPVRGLAKGTYYFTGVASLNDEHTVFQFLVIVGEGQVDPPIPPKPPEPPVPPPDTNTYDSPIRLFIVEETSMRTTAVTKLLTDVEFWNDLEKQGYIMRPYDITGADAKRLGLDKIKQPVPFLLVTAKDGTIIKDYPLPLTRDGVKAVLPKIKPKLPIGLETQPSIGTTIQPQFKTVSAPMHSHTCPFDGTTWWHTDASFGNTAAHTCPTCGRVVWDKDKSSNANMPLKFSSPLQSNCPGGVCPTPSYVPTRRGLFR